MAVNTTPFDVLFDPARSDASIWHAWPRGLHSFGLLAPPLARKTPGVFEASDTSGSSDDRVGRKNRPPALAHGTIQSVLPDAISLWLEGGKLSRASFNRTDWRWYPTHVGGTWEAEGTRIELRVAMIDGNDAVLEARITNTGATPLNSDLVVRGDDNYITLCRGGAHQIKGDYQFASDRAVLVNKHPQMAQEMEYFPYSGLLPADDPKFEYEQTNYQFVFSFGDGSWKQESAPGSDGFVTWQLRRPMSIAPGQTERMQIGFAASWTGRTEARKETAEELARRAANAQKQPFEAVVSASRKMWSALLAKATPLKRDWPAEWIALYYKAWVTTWADLLPPGDLYNLVSKRHIVACLRIGDSPYLNPASWEGALGALILSLADPKLGCECLEAIYDTTGEDGYISETLGSRQGTALACVEPWVAWACYKNSGDKEFLRRIWDRLKLNLSYRLHFPVFKHGTTFNTRNYAYGNISARAALKIAKEINRPPEDIAKIEQMISETDRIVHAFWNEKEGFHHSGVDPNERAGGPAAAFSPGTDAPTLVALLGVARPRERRRMIEFCREQYLMDSGSLRVYPKDAAASTGGHRKHLAGMSAFTVKESELLPIFKGIKDLDRDLFEKVARGTVANILRDGDFWECMTQDGHGRHNGPGSIFGAFAVIWALLLMEDQVDELYE